MFQRILPSQLRGVADNRKTMEEAVNPFLSLFSSPEAVQKSSDVRKRDAQQLSDLLERIFLFSASPGKDYARRLFSYTEPA